MKDRMNVLPLKTLPSVLSFRRGVLITDALLEYGSKNGEVYPVAVIRHGAIGTQNVNEKKTAVSDDGTVSDGERNVANPQEVESAKTGVDMINLQVSFGMKALDMADSLYACASSKKGNAEDSRKLKEMLTDFVERAKDSQGLVEVSRRIARNIVNGRWLWRNRLIASHVRVEINAGENHHWVVDDALKMSLTRFDDYSDIEKEIGEIIADGFRGKAEKVSLSIRATLDLGVSGSVEVFASQNYEPDTSKTKGKGGLSRSLYKLPMPHDVSQESFGGANVVGQAAFRDAKIWNALRTMDTWYPEYEDGDMPIAIEPQGASLSMMRFFRAGKSHKNLSAFELFKRLNQIDTDSPEGMYCMASLLRGGVFGESEKAEKGDTAKMGEAIDEGEDA